MQDGALGHVALHAHQRKNAAYSSDGSSSMKFFYNDNDNNIPHSRGVASVIKQL